MYLKQTRDPWMNPDPLSSLIGWKGLMPSDADAPLLLNLGGAFAHMAAQGSLSRAGHQTMQPAARHSTPALEPQCGGAARRHNGFLARRAKYAQFSLWPESQSRRWHSLEQYRTDLQRDRMSVWILSYILSDRAREGFFWTGLRMPPFSHCRVFGLFHLFRLSLATGASLG